MAESVNLLFEAWCARSRDPAPCAPRGPPKYVPCFLVCSDRACLADTYSSTTDSRLHSFTAFMVFTLTFLDFHASPLSSFICSCSHFFSQKVGNMPSPSWTCLRAIMRWRCLNKSPLTLPSMSYGETVRP